MSHSGWSARETAPMMLRYSPPSPYSRIVRIAAALAGVADRIELVPANTSDPADSLRGQAPLGKIPVLIDDAGRAIYDSRVIVDYLDASVGGGRLIPAGGSARTEALTLAALAEGILDAALLQVYEVRFRPPHERSATAMAYQAEKVTRSLQSLEAAPPAMTEPIHVGLVALACALGYLDLRFEGTWRATFPRLVAWLEAFAAAVPAFEATRVTPT